MHAGLLEPGRNAVYPLAALTIGARLAVADAYKAIPCRPVEAGSASGFLNLLDRFDRHAVDVGNLGDRHSVFHQGTKTCPFLCRDVRCRR
jgi:hypothetical protein